LVPALSAGPETRWPIPRVDTAKPDAHSRCSDGWNPAGLKGESRKRDFPRDSPPGPATLMAMAFTLPEGGRGIFKPPHHQEAHGLSLLGKQP